MRAAIDQGLKLDRLASGASEVRGDSSAAFARVEVTADPRRASETWHEMEQVAAVSPYQTARFLLPWLATEGAAAAVTPLLATAYDGANQPVAFLPLGVQHGRFVRTAAFLGGKHSNFNMGLFRPGVAWQATELRRLLRAVARAAPLRPDLFVLLNQPHEWNGVANPLALLPQQASPSSSYWTDLPTDPEIFFAACHSAHARKNLRNKVNRLEAMGPVRHEVARTPPDIERILEACLAQKAAKLAAMGVAGVIEHPAFAAFLKAAALPRDGAPGALELHALVCGDTIVATFGGLAHAGRFSGLLISHEGRSDIAKTSPGELLLMSVLRMKCLDGFTSFDLGIGEARYKDIYCPLEAPLFDSIIPVSTKGAVWCAGEANRLRLKSRIKRSPRAWATAQRLRKVKARLFA